VIVDVSILISKKNKGMNMSVLLTSCKISNVWMRKFARKNSQTWSVLVRVELAKSCLREHFSYLFLYESQKYKKTGKPALVNSWDNFP